MPEFITKSEVADRLCQLDSTALTEAQAESVSSLAPDWRIFARFASKQRKGVVELSRTFAVPRDKTDEERKLIVSKFIPITAQNLDTTPEALSHFDGMADRAGLSTIRPANARQGLEAWYFKINLTNHDVTEKPPITAPLIGGVIRVDLMLAEFGMEFVPTVDRSAIQPFNLNL